MIRSGASAALFVVTTGFAPSVGFAQTPDDVCALYTREEVAALSKDEVRRPRSYSNQLGTVTSTTCRYTTRYDSWSVSINLERGRTADDLEAMLGALTRVAKGTTSKPLEPVSGVGDKAYWGNPSPTSGMLHIVSGTDFLSIQTFGKAPGAGTLAKTKEIGIIVLQRLKERFPTPK